MQTAPRTAEEWCLWAQHEAQHGRPARARIGFERAIAMAPGNIAAQFGLASLLLDIGDLAAAADVVDRMRAIGPERRDTLWLTARLATARGDNAGARLALERLLADRDLSDAQRAEALLMLGIAQDERGDTEAAMTAAIEGKRLQRAQFAADATRRESEVAKLRRVKNWITATTVDWRAIAPPEPANAAQAHIFLLGFPRSGTTLLEQILAAHPEVEALEEGAMLAAAFQAFLSNAEACARLEQLKPDEALAWAEHYWRRVREQDVDIGGKLFVDKQPAGTVNLPLIARLFPRAKILFALRDPRDVVLSCYRQSFAMNAMTYAFTDLRETAACYDACMALADAARPRLPLAWLDVRHEALVEDFAGELARIAAFLEIAPDPAMAAFPDAANARTIRTPSASQVRAGLNRRGLGRWRRYGQALEPVLPLLAPWAERFGYPA